MPQVTSSSKTNTTTYVYPSTSVLAKKVLTSAETTEVKNIITANTSSNSIQYVSVDKLVSLLDDHEVSKVVKEYQTVLAKMNKILKAKLAEINKIEEAREEAKDSATGMPCPSYLIDY
ncbi:MAG: hypothetical protein LBG59_02420 [Candidatus Peribacteria bacterium]|nr:hypothetical protein [Candidatus Peribacteria bacterium]